MNGDLFGLCRSGPFRPLSSLPGLRLDLRYASPDNLCGQDLYRGETEAWLHQDAWAGLQRASAGLATWQPGWSLRIYDAARPVSVQRQLFARVAGTPQQAYVADPNQGSVHNYGFALDLGLEDAHGRELDLGTGFDSFDPLAQPQLEEAFLAQGRLQAAQVERRRLLRRCMALGTFKPHPLEWWHFEQKSVEELRHRYPLLDT